MTENEKTYKLGEYFARVKAIFGHRLRGYDCRFFGDKAVMQVVYCDYKTTTVVRKELQKLMPEVELATVRREISDTAKMTEISEIAWTAEYKGYKAVVVAPNGEQYSLAEWAQDMLYDEDLTKRKLNYDEQEMQEPERNNLYLYLHE